MLVGCDLSSGMLFSPFKEGRDTHFGNGAQRLVSCFSLRNVVYSHHFISTRKGTCDVLYGYDRCGMAEGIRQGVR